jgi:hypothetical protein
MKNTTLNNVKAAHKSTIVNGIVLNQYNIDLSQEWVKTDGILTERKHTFLYEKMIRLWKFVDFCYNSPQVRVHK